MNTESIINSLNIAAISKAGIPNRLLLDIAKALQEREALRATGNAMVAELETLNERIAEDAELIEALRAERESKVAQWHEAGVRLMECADEIKRLRAALSAIVTASATMQDMSQPLEDARRLVGDSQ